jgi:16S rRNA (uracil1498-N3)-methyltransferase
VKDFAAWIAEPLAGRAAVLSLRPEAVTAGALATGSDDLTCLLGPEGGLQAKEEDAALATGFTPLSLGTRVLRSETAGVAVLARLLL